VTAAVASDAAPLDAGAAVTKAAAEAGPSPDAGARSAFAGSYQGKDRAIIRVPGKPEQREDDPKARITVAEQGGDTIGITLINSADGTPICTLNAKVRADSAEVAAGQSCFGGPGMSSTVQRGSAKLAGARLTVELFIEMRLPVAGQNATGSIDYHFEGTRQ
jgi:hypothetical protein